MDFSQVLASQKLNDQSRHGRANNEDVFYETHGSSLYATTTSWPRNIRASRNKKRRPAKEVLCRAAVQKVC